MTRFDEYQERMARVYGNAWDNSRLDPEFIHWFNTGERVRVVTTYADGSTFERTGTVSVTTGWRPVFLLMHRSNSHGSWDTLDDSRTRVVAVKRGRTYQNLHTV